MHFDNSYARLPPRFFAQLAPTPVAEPRLIQLNEPLALDLGLEPRALRAAEGVQMLAGNRVPVEAAPIAMAYAGHQFGQWVPQLGDGRAILLGEIIDVHGIRRDIQLKGAGPTPYSRMGDGRAALGPVLREYLVSESMHALGVPSTRSLAAVSTGERVRRDGWLPGAVLTRVASSHVRIGTFEFFANRGDHEGVRTLAQYCIARHYPQCLDDARPALAFFRAVLARTAALIARWQQIGFIHGVMNTDNMSIAGETIDFGPCAFMDEYHPRKVFSSIDHAGRYAYANQPAIAQWNLARLAQALLPLIDTDESAAVSAAQAELDGFALTFDAAYLTGMRAKLGLDSPAPGDADLVLRLLQCMAEQQADYTLTFRGLCAMAELGDASAPRALFADPQCFDDWAASWQARLADEHGREAAARAGVRKRMERVNPVLIPRNHRIEEVIMAAQSQGDFRPFERMLSALQRPYDEGPDVQYFARPPQPHEVVSATFCGT